MKTSRTDVKRNLKQVRVPNASFNGYSTTTLRYGDYFLYMENGEQRLAKCHGRVKPLYALNDEPIMWYILAQVADHMMTYTCERWIKPVDVCKTKPGDRMYPHIKSFFEEHEEV